MVIIFLETLHTFNLFTVAKKSVAINFVLNGSFVIPFWPDEDLLIISQKVLSIVM